MKTKSFCKQFHLPEPTTCEQCLKFYQVLDYFDLTNVIGMPLVSLKEGSNWHFSGEPESIGFSFWFIISCDKKLVIVIPKSSECYFHAGTKCYVSCILKCN